MQNYSTITNYSNIIIVILYKAYNFKTLYNYLCLY